MDPETIVGNVDSSLRYIKTLDGEINNVFQVEKEGEVYVLKIAHEQWKRKQYEKEVKILQRVTPHPHIMELETVYGRGSYQAHLLKFVYGNPINDTFCREEQLENLELQKQVLETVLYLHENGVTHGDIERRHIIISREHSHITLIDFDRAKIGGSKYNSFEKRKLKDLEYIAKFCPNVKLRVEGRLAL